MTVEVDVWLPPDGDADAALDALEALDGRAEARIAEIDARRHPAHGRTRAIRAAPSAPAREAELRADALRGAALERSVDAGRRAVAG